MIPMGPVVIICGIGAITVLFQDLVIACVVGMVGIIIGIATLRIDVEKLDKYLAGFGIVLCLVPIIYVMAILARNTARLMINVTFRMHA